MLIDPKRLSAAIRAQKKKAMRAEPELVHTDSHLDLNPMDMYNKDQQARIETTLKTPHKNSTEETMMAESEHDASGIGLSDEDKKRMGRLRAYIAGLHLNR